MYWHAHDSPRNSKVKGCFLCFCPGWRLGIMTSSWMQHMTNLCPKPFLYHYNFSFLYWAFWMGLLKWIFSFLNNHFCPTFASYYNSWPDPFLNPTQNSILLAQHLLWCLDLWPLPATVQSFLTVCILHFFLHNWLPHVSSLLSYIIITGTQYMVITDFLPK